MIFSSSACPPFPQHTQETMTHRNKIVLIIGFSFKPQCWKLHVALRVGPCGTWKASAQSRSWLRASVLPPAHLPNLYHYLLYSGLVEGPRGGKDLGAGPEVSLLLLPYWVKKERAGSILRLVCGTTRTVPCGRGAHCLRRGEDRATSGTITSPASALELFFGEEWGKGGSEHGVLCHP